MPSSLPPNQPAPEENADTIESVSKVEEGAFMNLTSAIQSIHLKVWVTVESTGTLRVESISLADERALVHSAGRLFFQGNAEEATKQIRQAQTGFSRKKSDWESRVRRSEDDSARRRAMRELQQKKSNHNPINSRVSPAENQFRRLVEALDVHLTLEKRRALELGRESLTSEPPVSKGRKQAALPAGFSEAIGKTEIGERESVVKRFFDVEAKVTVEVADAEGNRKSVTFNPPLPKNRLYYIANTAQVIRLRRVKISKHVHFHNCLTEQNETMPLPNMIEIAQAGGVWLLRLKAEETGINDSPAKVE